MAQEILQIKITADNKQAVAAMQQTISGLNGVSVAAGKSASAMSKSQVNYQNFGRVLQDLPYGFNGVANNLTQLIPSVGALGLAFSGVVSALTFMQVGTGAWTRGLTGAKTAVQDLEKAMEGFRDSAAKEIVKFKELQMTASNANIPLVQRKQAVDQLQKEYPAYLGNLSQEDILAGKIGNAYDKVLSALKAKIALQAAEEKVLPIIREQLEVAEQLAVAKKRVANVAGITEEDFKASERFATATGKAISPLKGLQAEAIAAAADVNKLTAEYDALEAKIGVLFKGMEPFIQASSGLNQEAEKQKKAIFDIVKFRQKMAGLMAESLFAAPEVQEPAAKAPKMQAGLPTSAAQIQEMITKARLANMEKIRQQEEEDAAWTEKNLARQAEIYNGILTPAINTMFNALAGGENVLDSLGNMFKQLAIQIAATLAKTAALAGIISIISGGKISFGNAFKLAGGLGRGLPQFATGGTATGPKSGYPVVLHGTEHIVRPDQMNAIISQSVNGALGQIKGMGGGMANTAPQILLRGQDLWLMYGRTIDNLNLRKG